MLLFSTHFPPEQTQSTVGALPVQLELFAAGAPVVEAVDPGTGDVELDDSPDESDPVLVPGWVQMPF